MSEILFVTWDGGGNVPPATAIARQLQTRGHTVRFLGHRSQRPALEEEGFQVEEASRTRDFTRFGDTSPFALLAALGDRGMGEDLRTALARRPADLVVVDCLTLGVLAAAPDLGVPYVVLEHLHHAAYVGMLGSPLGLVMRLRRLGPARALDAARARIVTSLPSLDPLDPDDNLVQVGPVVEWSPRLPHTEPMVLLSASTFGYAGLHDALQRLVDATASLAARVVVTTGPALEPRSLRLPSHVEAHAYVPHRELMPAATVFVGHGGHGSTTAALAHDLPMVLMPMDPRTDQPTMAAAVERAGAGVAVPRKAGVDQIAEAMAAMLADGPHRAAAAHLGAEVRAMPGDVLGADAVETALVSSPAGA
jgi:UDP:flavonoid glycosyltransferase YjiC (YdhE family)